MRVVWTRKATQNLRDIRAFIADEDARAAKLIAERILSSVDRLKRFPGMGRPGRKAGTRELPVPRTPFLVPYRVEDDQVEILAVIHGAQGYPDTDV